MGQKLKQRGFLSQRTWGIVAVLCAFLAVPYWWAKRTGQKTASELALALAKDKSKNALPVAQAPNPTTPVAPAASPDRYGLSFGHLSSANVSSSLMVSACSGEPTEMANPDKGQCNPTQGDTSCRTALPVLCVLKDGSTAESAGLVNTPKVEGAAVAFDAYASWAGGSLGATTPVAGFVLGSLAQANARCTAELGPGWRMATAEDGGRWSLVGKRGAGLGGPSDPTGQSTRHWVHTGVQKANCWDAN
jgi:hypothetical protein